MSENFLHQLKKYTDQKIIPVKNAEIFKQFYNSYKETVEQANSGFKNVEPLFCKLLELVKEQLLHPFVFEPFHKQIREPFDYYQFGLDLTRPLIDKNSSTVMRWDVVKLICKQIANGENVILLANHQTELDPQIIGCMLEEQFSSLAADMIFVAGGRVTSDPLAVPFSMGCNLLCIYSKKHIDNPLEQKMEKQLHNKRTMNRMSQLLSEGGKCIYVAPSGGRDRRNANGDIEIAPFDPGSIEMFRLMALQSKKHTHFYPLALDTYELLPPPNSVEKELGEKRSTTYTGVHLAFGKEYHFEELSNASNLDKKQRRQAFANDVWLKVKEDYETLIQKFNKRQKQ